MSYDAKVFNVMIASPSDVESERSIVREVIYEWNAVHSEREKYCIASRWLGGHIHLQKWEIERKQS